ncbi:hypothetical protein [Micromonospora sp. NPDC005806]|uniref:hypothetical protein n=1 Tax=Micromonospora sp. NPDC005806 TaxID=3364234 RepID=UPI003684B0C7
MTAPARDPGARATPGYGGDRSTPARRLPPDQGHARNRYADRDPARPARLLAALTALAAVTAALAARRPGRLLRVAAATVVVAGLGRRLTDALPGPGGQAGDPADPTRSPDRAGSGLDELRLWVEAGSLRDPLRPGHTTDPLSS